MGKRFLASRYPLVGYSARRSFLRLNEGEYEPHKMKPYGISSGKFMYHQMFEKKNQSREANRRTERTMKKAARRLDPCSIDGVC